MPFDLPVVTTLDSGMMVETFMGCVQSEGRCRIVNMHKLGVRPGET